jgi:UDP-N-acetylmuramate--alanine ligase
MSALAQYLRFAGRKVSGSDRGFDRGGEADKRAYFEGHGIHITPQDGSGLTSNHTSLIVSTAIEADNPEIRRARELGIPVLHRSELLARLCGEKKTIAIAGTSGKSTVAGMAYHVLEAGGLSPSLITGANLLSLQERGLLGNAVAGSGEWLVIEADESDGSLTRYNPEVGLLLNIEKDHQEVEALLPLFRTFRSQCKRAVINDRDARCLALRQSGDMTYDRESLEGVRIENPIFEEWSSSFKLAGELFEIPVPGRHNVENALAATALGKLLGVSMEACAEGLRRYQGVERRFIRMGEVRGITVVDDFAHNPAKVKAALETAKGKAHGKNRRVLAIFHPHGFAPMKLMGRDIMDAMAEVLTAEDRVFLPEIYYVGGTADQSVSSKDLIEYLNTRLPPQAATGLEPIGHFIPSKDAILAAVTAEARPGDFVISMGARDPDLSRFAHKLLQALEASAASPT